MKTWCVKDHLTGHVFKILVTEEELRKFLSENKEYGECVDCVECDDAPSIVLE